MKKCQPGQRLHASKFWLISSELTVLQKAHVSAHICGRETGESRYKPELGEQALFSWFQALDANAARNAMEFMTLLLTEVHVPRLEKAH